MKKLKMFKDLGLEPYPSHFAGGFRGRLFFENGYGVSVIQNMWSYTSAPDEYELAVLEGTEKKWRLTYETPITKDVLGHLKPFQVSRIMAKVQNLPKVKIKPARIGKKRSA